jgi:hypothetical protein
VLLGLVLLVAALLPLLLTACALRLAPAPVRSANRR